MEKINHPTGASEIVLDDQEKKDMAEVGKMKKAKKQKHTDLTDDEVKRLVFIMAKNQGLL